VLLGVALLGGSVQASPELVPYITTTAGWNVFYHSGTGNCGTIRLHQRGTKVIVNYERSNDTWTFSLGNDRWDKVQGGEKFNVSIRLDTGGNWRGVWEGSRWQGHPLITLANVKTEFLKQFMAANSMTISTEGDGNLTTVYLDGSWDALMQTVACQKSYAGRT